VSFIEGKPPDRILAGPYLLMYITAVREYGEHSLNCIPNDK